MLRSQHSRHHHSHHHIRFRRSHHMHRSYHQYALLTHIKQHNIGNDFLLKYLTITLSNTHNKRKCTAVVIETIPLDRHHLKLCALIHSINEQRF